MKEPITATAEALAAAAGDVTPDPAVLEDEAAQLDAAAIELVSRPGELWAEAAARRALAAAIRVRAAALEAMADADAAVARAEAAYEATAGPETEAVTRATQARQQFQGARDALAQARDKPAPVAELADLDGRVVSAARVDQWEHEKLADAQQTRASAYQAVLQARRRRAEARARLDAAQVGVDHPADAAVDPAERFRMLAFAWPYKVLAAENGSGPKLTKAELATCRLLAEAMCDVLGGTPPAAAQRVRARTARETRAELAQMASIGLAGGTRTAAGDGQVLAKAR
jgi:colicin import membrane protein